MGLRGWHRAPDHREDGIQEPCATLRRGDRGTGCHLRAAGERHARQRGAPLQPSRTSSDDFSDRVTPRGGARSSLTLPHTCVSSAPSVPSACLFCRIGGLASDRARRPLLILSCELRVARRQPPHLPARLRARLRLGRAWGGAGTACRSPCCCSEAWLHRRRRRPTSGIRPGTQRA